MSEVNYVALDVRWITACHNDSWYFNRPADTAVAYRELIPGRR
ncbi:MAG: hypothetical protein ACT4P6_04655 [Gemmatimonadaceae bacterium]